MRKFLAPELVFGRGARTLAGQYARNLGARKVLLVSDPGVRAAGWTEQVFQSLEQAGVDAVVYAGVSPNPRAGEVEEGADLFRREGCDALVAVGGGSPIDCAKGIGILTSNPGSILEFEGVDRVARPMPPLICIPTTAGTSADVSQFAIITDLAARVKIAIVSKAVVPDLSLIDPETLLTMDPFLAACTGMDALVHALEAFASNASSPITDVHALEAIRLLSRNLVASHEHPEDLDLREQVMLGSLEAGLAFSNASLGCVHAMAHSLGGFLDLPHGQCNSILLWHVVDFNYAEAGPRYDRVAEAMDLDLRGLTPSGRRAAFVGHLRAMAERMGLTAGLSALGVGRTEVPDLSEKALRDVCMVTNPRAANLRDVEVLYEGAL